MVNQHMKMKNQHLFLRIVAGTFFVAIIAFVVLGCSRYKSGQLDSYGVSREAALLARAGHNVDDETLTTWCKLATDLSKNTTLSADEILTDYIEIAVSYMPKVDRADPVKISTLIAAACLNVDVYVSFQLSAKITTTLVKAYNTGAEETCNALHVVLSDIPEHMRPTYIDFVGNNAHKWGHEGIDALEEYLVAASECYLTGVLIRD